MPNLYALLVGIDKYPIPAHRLQGCVSDAQAFRQMLETRYGGPTLHAVSLLNEQATRANVIDTFRKHLGQAKPEDVALFFYAGHGSQVPTGGLFAEIEPDGLNESIVCWDSRLHGEHDLVDKDIATLIAELTEKGVHITVVFDCCHSGSGVRDMAKRVVTARRVEARTDPQPSAVYLRDPNDGVALRAAAVAGSPITLVQRAGFAPDTSGLYVLMAACADFQTAQEYAVGNVHHGAFTLSMLEVLNSTREPLGYEELWRRVKLLVRARVDNQEPQLETLGNDESRRNLFLHLVPAPPAEFFMAAYDGRQWQVEAGVLNGLEVSDTVALYVGNATSAELQDPEKAITTAMVTAVDAASSVISLKDMVDNSAAYKAVVVARHGKVNVQLDGDAEGVALLRPGISTSMYLQEGPAPRFEIRAGDGQFSVAIPGSDRRVTGPYPATAAGAGQAKLALEHMAKWTTRLELSNPASAIAATDVVFAIIDCDEKESLCPPTNEVALAYLHGANGGWEKPWLRLRIKNGGQRELYVAVLAFSQSWSIFTGLVAAGVQNLQPGEEFYPLSGQPIHTSVTPPATHSDDYLLLIASTDEFDATALALPSLEQAMRSTRDIDADEAQPAMSPREHDFVTRQVHIRTTGPGA